LRHGKRSEDVIIWGIGNLLGALDGSGLATWAYLHGILGHLQKLLRSAQLEHNSKLCELTPVGQSRPYHMRAFLQWTTGESE